MTDALRKAEIDVVIVNWNSGDLVERCVSALDMIARDAPSLNVLVVDNASTDGSERIPTPKNFSLRVIQNGTNIGFAAACNQGVAAGSADVVLLLNPDVKVGNSEALQRPLDFLRSSLGEQIAACGIQLRADDGSVSQTRSRFPTPLRVFGWMTGLDRIFPWIFEPQFLPVKAHNASGAVDVVMGAFFMVRRTVYGSLGGLSSRFFVYYEDVDFCRRALNRGLKSWFLADVCAIHLGQGTTRNIKATRYFYCTRSRVIYGMRHFTRSSAWLIGWGLLTIEPVVRILYSVILLKPAFGIETVRGARRLWADARHFMRSQASD